jgi:methylenetetrahydrofolate dehydrogenase (NADP+)/methenyltetrahydrofolate cyclohydrolase
LIANADATGTVCRSRTRDLSSIIHQTDILIVTIGQPEFVSANLVSEGTVAIDVRVNHMKDTSSPKSFRWARDVKFNEVAARQ